MSLFNNTQSQNVFSNQPISRLAIESLEARQLLHGGIGHAISMGSIEFSQAPAAVQMGLNTIASNDSLTAPTATQKLTLGNNDGIETYSVRLTGTGTKATLTIDVTGAAVTAPTKSTTTFGDLTNTAVTDEFTAIASALNLTAPASTDTVHVSTPTSGPVLYTLKLVGTSGHRGVSITLDDTGTPVGNESVPFSTVSSAIQTGLNALAPTGATALDPTSNQSVAVKTIEGVTTYSVTFKATGVRAVVTVDDTGAPVDLPSTTTDEFQNIPAAAMTELQALATADGVAGTIDPTQSVRINAELNGTTTIYSVTLDAANSSGTGTHKITLSVDENGNATVPPSDGGIGSLGACGGEFFGGGGFGRLAARAFGFRF